MNTDSVDEVVESLRGRLADTLIALDFDGTLAPIVPDPNNSRPVDGTVEVLVELAAQGAQLAVITGRGADTVVRLGGLDVVPRLIVEGVYGVERWQDGKLSTPGTPGPILALRDELPGVLARHGADPMVWIEDKRLSLVVHGRLADDAQAVLAPLLEPVTELGERLGLEIHPGRGVIELRLPGHDKGSVLRRLIAETSRPRVLFAGDDVGDLPAFEVIAELRRLGRTAWSVAATSDDVPDVAAAADVQLDSPAAVVALLRAIAGD